jgi:hypothetical protein
MFPRVRKYGIRYLFDQEFRRVMVQREKDRRRRKVRGSGFLSRVKKIKHNLAAIREPKCVMCKKYFELKDLTVDHRVRFCDGGTSDYKNLQLLCLKCHESKDKVSLSDIPPAQNVEPYSIDTFYSGKRIAGRIPKNQQETLRAKLEEALKNSGKLIHNPTCTKETKAVR